MSSETINIEDLSDDLPKPTTKEDLLKPHNDDIVTSNNTTIEEDLNKLSNDIVTVKYLLNAPKEEVIGKVFVLNGRIRSIRKQKLAFVVFNDGSCFDNLQLVYSCEDSIHIENIQLLVRARWC